MYPRTEREKQAAEVTRFIQSLDLCEYDAVMKFYRLRRKQGMSTPTVAECRAHLEWLTKNAEGNGFDSIEAAA